MPPSQRIWQEYDKARNKARTARDKGDNDLADSWEAAANELFSQAKEAEAEERNK